MRPPLPSPRSLQGKLSQAEELHRRALKIRQYTLGEEHPSTVASLGHLGLALMAQGKTQVGQALRRRAAEIRSRTRGSGRQYHPSQDPDYYGEEASSWPEEKGGGLVDSPGLPGAYRAGPPSSDRALPSHKWSPTTGRQITLRDGARGGAGYEGVDAVRREQAPALEAGVGIWAEDEPTPRRMRSGLARGMGSTGGVRMDQLSDY